MHKVSLTNNNNNWCRARDIDCFAQGGSLAGIVRPLCKSRHHRTRSEVTG